MRSTLPLQANSVSQVCVGGCYATGKTCCQPQWPCDQGASGTATSVDCCSFYSGQFGCFWSLLLVNQFSDAAAADCCCFYVGQCGLFCSCPVHHCYISWLVPVFMIWCVGHVWCFVVCWRILCWCSMCLVKGSMLMSVDWCLFYFGQFGLFFSW